MSRRTTLASGAMALPRTCALGACGVDPKQDVVASELAPRADTALRNRIDGGPPLSGAGDAGRGVAAAGAPCGCHSFQPVLGQPGTLQANSLVDAVLRSSNQGLDSRAVPRPPCYGVGRHCHRSIGTCCLSDTFLSYAEHVGPRRRAAGAATRRRGPDARAGRRGGRARQSCRQRRTGGGDRGAGAKPERQLTRSAPDAAKVSARRAQYTTRPRRTACARSR